MTGNALGYPLHELDGRGAGNTVREISQQPALWREVGETAMSRREETEAFLRPMLERSNLRIVLTGAGTSAFAGGILAPALTRKLQRSVDAVATTDIVSNPREFFAQDRPTLLVSFARSGDSPESVAATELAEQCLSEVSHLIITCNPDGVLYRRHRTADGSLALLMPELANDQGFAMTSSFTCMMLATWLTLDRTPPAAGLVERLAVAGEHVLATYGSAARRLSEQGYERVVYLGSGALTGLARESALKLLELTAGAVISYFDSALAFRHGPKSVLTDRTLALVYLSNDAHTRQYDVDILGELRGALGHGNVVAITAKQQNTPEAGNTWLIEGVDNVDDAVVALPFALCAQLLGLHFSLALGRIPDNPFPAGQVNRVVQGVTIHPLFDE